MARKGTACGHGVFASIGITIILAGPRQRQRALRRRHGSEGQRKGQNSTEFFRSTGKVNKYNSPEEIIEDFYLNRLGFCQKRKAACAVSYSLTSKIPRTDLTGACDAGQDWLAQPQLEKLSNQARFVKMDCRQGVESNRKKANIVQELRPKAAGETEDVETNDDAKAEAASGTSTAWVWSLTNEKVRTRCSHLFTFRWFADQEGPSASSRQEEEAAGRSLRSRMWNIDLDGILEEWGLYMYVFSR